MWRAIKSQSRRFGAKLMGLYLILLLVPVSGVGLYGHYYIQQGLSQYLLRSKVNEIAIYAVNLQMLLTQVQEDVHYLDEELSNHPQGNLQAYTDTHPLYHNVVWLDPSGHLMDGNYSEALQAWAQGSGLRTVVQLPMDSVHLNPLLHADNTASLAAMAQIDDGILLMEIDANYLLGGISNQSSEYDWSLWIGPETVLTTASSEALDGVRMDAFTETSGHFAVGDKVHIYHQIGPESAWALVQTLPAAYLEPDLSSYYTTFSILLIGGLVSVMGFALFAIARIIEPVYQLTERVEKLRQGEPHPQFHEPLPADEFGELMAAFDQMAVELEHQRRVERELVEQLITAQEEERKFIAYDLHDGLIQKLVGARFYLRQCRQPAADDAQDLTRGYDVLTEAIAEGRRIIQGLHPTVLDDLGLEAALQDCADAMAKMAGWQIEVDLIALDQQPDRVTNVTLYRVAQEALNNIFKHAGAAHVRLSLTCEGDHLRLTVKDDGCGFDVEDVLENNAGWGIRTMRERATMLHGTYTVQSTPQHGTTIQIMVAHKC